MFRIILGIVLLASVPVLRTGESLWWWGIVGIVPLVLADGQLFAVRISRLWLLFKVLTCSIPDGRTLGEDLDAA